MLKEFKNFKLIQHVTGNLWFGILLNEKYGFLMDSNGGILSKKDYVLFDGITGGDYEFILLTTVNNKSALFDLKGKLIFPEKYECLCCFWDGLAVVKNNNKYGYIDINGNEVIPIIYDFADDFKNGKARVKLNHEEYFIDKNGIKI